MKKFYISTPIYYSSGKPHIGHAYTTILADCLNRYKKLLNYETFFVTGMDEHGQKIESISKKENISCDELVNRNSQIFEDLWKKLNINFNCFIRTTNKEHIEFVQNIFSKLYSNEHIYLNEWTSNYCVQCEEDIIEKKIKEINGDKFCEQGHKIIFKKEESYFLKIINFKDWITKILSEETIKIIPKNRINELLNNFLNDDFRDLSISRLNLNWGIEIKENSKHKIYVWIDALMNYLSSLKICNENNIKYFWEDENCEIVHILSKEIIRFHCIYWPIILKMLDYRLPNKIISHGWIVTSEGKMSKSIGNVVDPFELINKYNSDSLRYYLLKEISINNDSIFSEKLLISTHNSDLCNNFGNLINRNVGLIKKYNSGFIPKFQEPKDKISIDFKNNILLFIDEIEILINNLDINLLIKKIIEFENLINKNIEEIKPWILFKENKIDELNSFLSILANSIKVLIFFISPILVTKSEEIWNKMNLPKGIFNFNEMKNFNNINNIILREFIIPFQRIEEYEN